MCLDAATGQVSVASLAAVANDDVGSHNDHDDDNYDEDHQTAGIDTSIKRKSVHLL